MPLEVLPAQDATLWWVQSGGAPLQIGALCTFEGAPLRDAEGRLRIGELRRRMEARLRHTPRFRQRLVTLPLGQGLAWVDDERFDIDEHARIAQLPSPGGDVELRELVAHLVEVPLDPRRPLWEIWFVDGLAGDRVAVIPKVNHVMADGMALLEFSLSMLDPTPEPPDDEAEDWHADPRPGALSLLGTSLVERGKHQVGALWRLASGVADPRAVLGAAAAIGRLGTSGRGTAPALPVTHPVGAHRDVAWTRLPWPDLDRLRKEEGATLNDVVLALSAGALAHYLARAEVALGGREPRVLVPVSTHGGAPGEEVENRFSLMVADIPVGIADPRERLRAVRDEMARHKASSQTALGPLLFSIGDLVAPWLLHALGPPLLRNQPFVNLAVSNMPGTRDPLYMLGAEMLELYPYISGVGNIAVIIGVLSYRDALGVGITVDADVVPDVDVLVEGMERACEELLASTA